jgi:zinc protease
MVSKQRLALICLAAAAATGLAAGLSGCKDSKELAALGVRFQLQKHKLGNGLQIILVEDPTVPMVSYQTWFRVGSVDEHAGITGIAHLFEHLMFKGTPKYGAKEFFQRLEAKGAEVNAFTTRDYTVFYETFIPEILPQVIDMEADRMTNLTLDDQLLNSERLVVLEERRLRTDNSPDGKIQEAIWDLAFRVHPYKSPVIGSPQDILSISLTQLQDFYRLHYQPANAAVVVVGRFQAAEVLAQLKAAYGGIPSTPRPKRDVPKEPEQSEERRYSMRDQVASERVTQAYHITAASNEESYAVDVLANILFEGTNARAYKRLVEEKDVALAVSGNSYTPTYPGLFTIALTMKGGVPGSVGERELAAVIAEVQERGVTEEEVQAAVRQLTVQVVDGIRTPHGTGSGS